MYKISTKQILFITETRFSLDIWHQIRYKSTSSFIIYVIFGYKYTLS